MTAGDRVEIGVLTVCGLLVGVVTVFYLQVRVGGVPLPVTALAAAALNVVLLRIAAAVTETGWRWAPLTAWSVVLVLGLLPGLRGNMMLYGAGAGPDWRLLLLLACGLGAPALASSMARLDKL